MICQSHPREAFITWLALRDRLSTNERIVSWGISCDILCVLCRACIENRDHIFFKCPISQRIWRIIKRWCCQEGLDDELSNLITWAVQAWKWKNLREDCCRLGFSAGIYHVWAQRNSVKHQGTVITEEQILGVIKNQVEYKIESKGVYPSSSINKRNLHQMGYLRCCV